MLSIVIVNWKTRDLLRACLVSIQQFPPSDPHEVVVVDNASGDGSAEMVRSDFPDAILIESGGNLGYAAGNNLGIAAAKGDLILTLNPDTEMTEGALDAAIQCLREREVGAVGVKLILPDGSVQRSVRGFPCPYGIAGMVLGIDRRHPESRTWACYSRPAFDYDITQHAPQPMGTFLLFDRAKLPDPSRPFDESFPIFFNEVDLLKRMADQGHHAWHCAEASIHHVHGAGTKKAPNKMMVWESHKSLVRYFGKHLRGWRRIGLPLIAVLSYEAALVRARGWHGGFRPEHHNLLVEHD